MTMHLAISHGSSRTLYLTSLTSITPTLSLAKTLEGIKTARQVGEQLPPRELIVRGERREGRKKFLDPDEGNDF